MQCKQTTTATLTSNKNNNKSSSKITDRLRERARNVSLSAVRLSCVLSRLRFVSAAYSLGFGLALLRALLTSFRLCCMHSRLRLSHELCCRHAAKAALGSSSSDLSLSCVCARNFVYGCGSPTNTKAHESSAALTADRQRRLSSSSLCCCHSVAFVCFTVAHTQNKSRFKALSSCWLRAVQHQLLPLALTCEFAMKSVVCCVRIGSSESVEKLLLSLSRKGVNVNANN